MEVSIEIIKYLKAHSLKETFLYNNRNYLSKIYSVEQYYENRQHLLTQQTNI